MEINKKCICGAMWKAKGIPQRVAEKFMLEWDIVHSACGLSREPEERHRQFKKREKEYFEKGMK